MSGKPKRQPKATISITTEGDQLSMKVTFTPCAKTKGPMHLAHFAALEMMTDYAKKQKAEKAKIRAAGA